MDRKLTLSLQIALFLFLLIRNIFLQESSLIEWIIRIVVLVVFSYISVQQYKRNTNQFTFQNSHSTNSADQFFFYTIERPSVNADR
jgi:uncharacterized protein YacL